VNNGLKDKDYSGIGCASTCNKKITPVKTGVVPKLTAI
jgi:hypothetical protein